MKRNSPREEALALLEEFNFRGRPYNHSGIFLDEMLYEMKNKSICGPETKSDIEYRQNVKSIHVCELLFYFLTFFTRVRLGS